MKNKISKSNIFHKIFDKLTSQKTFLFLTISNIALFGAYLFFVGATTVEVVNRKNTEEGTRALQSSRASLEETYNEVSKMYTKDYAKTLGFIEALPMFYTTRSVNSLAYDQNKQF